MVMTTTELTTATPARSKRLSQPQGRDPIVLAVSGASAQPLAQRALQLMLQAGERVELVVSRGAIGVWQAELGVRVPSEPDAQERFWRSPPRRPTQSDRAPEGGSRVHSSPASLSSAPLSSAP